MAPHHPAEGVGLRGFSLRFCLGREYMLPRLIKRRIEWFRVLRVLLLFYCLPPPLFKIYIYISYIYIIYTYIYI